MKKLLSILGVVSLTVTGANNIVACNIETKTNEQKINFNQNVNELTCSFSNKNNLYFGTNDGAFVLKDGETTATKIDGISSSVYSLAVDSKDNIYFGTNTGAFVFTHGSDTPTIVVGIDKIVNSIAVDSKDNIYFGTDNGAFALKNKTNKAFKINGIDGEIRTINCDSKNNIYFVGNIVWKILNSKINNIIHISGFSSLFDIYSMKIDKNDDVYFSGVFIDTILYKLENNSDNVIPVLYKKNNTIPRSKENVISNLIIVNDYIYVLEHNIFVFYDNKEKQFNSIKGYNENENIQTAVYYNNNLYFGTNEKLYKLRINDKEAIKVNNIIGDLNNLISFKNKLFYSKNKNEIYSLFYSKNKNLYWIWIIISLLILLIIIIILFVIKFKVKKSNYRKKKTYIKNLFYQYYVPCSERQFEYFENKL
ncbi:hypothetical protein D6D54_07675, partial [Spiroplasma poulsonii]